MYYTIGIDSGGTKTDVWCFKNDQVLAKLAFSGFQMHNTSKRELLVHQLQNFLRNNIPNNYQKEKISVVAGFAGLDDTKDYQTAEQFLRLISQVIKVNQLVLSPDIFLPLFAGTEAVPAACIISGTGSNAGILLEHGTFFKTGDWGYLIGDQASGFNLSQRIIEQAVAELDQRLPKTGLAGMILEYYKVTSLPQLVGEIYHDENPVAKIASLIQALHDPEWQQHHHIRKQVTISVNQMLLMLKALARQLSDADQQIPLVLSGGVFQLTTLVTEPLITHINNELPQFVPILLTQKPVWGTRRLGQKLHRHESVPDAIKIIDLT